MSATLPYLIQILIVVAIVAFVIRIFRRSKRSTGRHRLQNFPQTFRCRRCSAIAEHSARTINAAHNGKKAFFCNSCHAEWLSRRASRVNGSRSGPRQSANDGRSGCLVVLACLISIPISLVLALLSAYQ